MNESVKLTEYSPGRSALKATGAVLQAAVAALTTLALALAADPLLAERLTEIMAGHRWAVVTVSLLVFSGRFAMDYRKHRDRQDPLDWSN